MRRSWAAATVGALVLLIGAISYFLVKATSERSGKSTGYVVWARFTDAAGLYQKSRVQTAGIPIGQIENRELDPERPVARVTVRIQPNVKLWENAVVSKKSASLLGEYYLEIDPGTPVGTVNGERRQMRQLKNGDEIVHVREPTAVGEIMDGVGNMVPIMRDILQDVRRLTSGPIASAAENTNKLIERNSVILESFLQKIDRVASDLQGITSSESANIRASIENIREITDSVKKLVGTSQDEVEQTGTAVRTSIEKLKSTVDNLDRSLANVEKITARVERGEGTVGHVLTDDTIARNIEDITEDAGGFIRTITRLQTVVGLRTEYNFLSSEFKQYLSIQLVPRPDKFYLIEIVDDPRGARETINSSTVGTNGVDVTSTTNYYQNRLKFTLQFGKRFGSTTGRFGIKESTGGFGVDLHLFRERFIFSVDVFDMQYNRFPRVQARGALAVYNHLYLIAGIDDVINDRGTLVAAGGFDWFMGAQLVFNDEDLKGLLLFGGGAAGAASK